MSDEYCKLAQRRQEALAVTLGVLAPYIPDEFWTSPEREPTPDEADP